MTSNVTINDLSDTRLLMREFTEWFFRNHFRSPMILDKERSQIMIQTGITVAIEWADSSYDGHINLYCILMGLTAAEKIKINRIDLDALKKVTDKYEMLPIIVGY